MNGSDPNKEPAISADDFKTRIISLQCSGSEGTYEIHEGILRYRGGMIHAAFEQHFREASEAKYKFQHTDDKTLQGFVLWAYTGRYEWPDIPGLERVICHVRLYIFAHIYQIPFLELICWENLAAELSSLINFLQGPHLEKYAMPVFELATSSLPTTDRLYRWIGMYAAWRFDELRVHPQFQNVADLLAPIMIHFISQDAHPWNCDGRPSEPTLKMTKPTRQSIINPPAPKQRKRTIGTDSISKRPRTTSQTLPIPL